MTITTINFLGAALLAIQAFVLYSLIRHKDEQRHIQAFFVFWGVVWSCVFTYYLLNYVNQNKPIELLGLSLDTKDKPLRKQKEVIRSHNIAGRVQISIESDSVDY